MTPISQMRRALPDRKSASRLLARLRPGYFAGQLRSPVFIIGCGRSGKTVLAKHIALHPHVAYWAEGNDIWDPQGYPWHESRLETPPIECDPYGFTRRWWRQAQGRIPQMLAPFGAYQRLSGAKHLLNDSHMNTFRVLYLLELLPDAKFIHVMRDGRDVALDYARQLYPKMSGPWSDAYRARGLLCGFDELTLRLAEFWGAGVEEIDRQDEALGLSRQGKLLEIRYEELCASPKREIAKACAFIGLDERLLPQDGVAGVRAHRAADNRSIASEELLAAIEARVSPALARKGYALAGARR